MTTEIYIEDDRVTLSELVDLALGTPEVGAVNFNILRILLHQVLKNANLDDVLADINDIDRNQIENFKNYIKGAGNMSPLPGVMKYQPGSQPQHLNPRGGATYFPKNSTPTPSVIPVNNQLTRNPMQRPVQPPQNQGPGQPQRTQQDRETMAGQQPRQPGQPQRPQGQPGQPNPPGVPQQQPGQPGQPQQQGPQPPGQQNQGQQTRPGTLSGGTQQPMPPGNQSQSQQTNPAKPTNQGAQQQQPQIPNQAQGGPGNPQQGQNTGTQYQPPPGEKQNAGTQPNFVDSGQHSPNWQPEQPQQTNQGQNRGSQTAPGQQQKPNNQQQATGPQGPQGQPGKPAAPGVSQGVQTPGQPTGVQTMPEQQPQTYIQPTNPSANMSQGNQAGGGLSGTQQQKNVPPMKPQPPGQPQGVQTVPIPQAPMGGQRPQQNQTLPPQQQGAGTQSQPGQVQTGPPQQGPGQPNGPPQQVPNGSPLRRRNNNGNGQPPQQNFGAQANASEQSYSSPIGSGIYGGGTVDSTTGTPRRDTTPSRLKKIEDKVLRLESHLEALYALPTNKEILEFEDSKQMSVNDMWQIIQLNNRIAAAEAAIQKMASLIEDLARQLKSVKKDSENSLKLNNELAALMDPQVMNATLQNVENLRGDLEKYKDQLQKEIHALAKATGVDLGKVPSFMNMHTPRDSEPILDANGKPILGPDGKPLTKGQVLLDKDGNPILGADGKPILKPGGGTGAGGPGGAGIRNSNPHVMALGPNGNPILGPDGKPIMVEEPALILGPDGKPIMGPDGKPLRTSSVKPLLGPDGKPVLGPDGKVIMIDDIRLMLGPDGRPLLGPNGKPIFVPAGRTVLGPDGKPLLGASGIPIPSTMVQVMKDQSGNPVKNSIGLPLISHKGQMLLESTTDIPKSSPDGKVLFSSTGQVTLTPDGKMQLDGNGNTQYGMVGEPLRGSGTEVLIGSDNMPLYIVPAGTQPEPLYNSAGQLIPDGGQNLMTNRVLLGSDGKPQLDLHGDPIPIFNPASGQVQLDARGAVMLGEDGRPVYSHLGTQLKTKDGAPMLSSSGMPLYSNFVKPMTDTTGKPLVGANNQPYVQPNGQPANHVIGQILTTPEGKPLQEANGELIFATLGQLDVFPAGGFETYPDGSPRYTNNNQLIRNSRGQIVFPPPPLARVSRTEVHLDLQTGLPVYSGKGKDIMGPDGKPVLGADGRPLGSNLGQMLLGTNGRPVLDDEGKPLYSTVGQLVQDENGRLLRGPDGKFLYHNIGQLMVNAEGRLNYGPDGNPAYNHRGSQVRGEDGSPLYDHYGKPIYLSSVEQAPGKPMLDPEGRPFLGSDGKPMLSNQVLLGPDGKPIMGKDRYPIALMDKFGGQLVLGPDGKPTFDGNNQAQYSLEGEKIMGGDDTPLVGADGKPLTSNIGELLYDMNGAPVIGKDGKPVYSVLGQVMVTVEGKPRQHADGKIMYANLAQIMLGPDKKPLFGRDGRPLYSHHDSPIVAADGTIHYKDGSNRDSVGSQSGAGTRGSGGSGQDGGSQTDGSVGKTHPDDMTQGPIPVGIADGPLFELPIGAPPPEEPQFAPGLTGFASSKEALDAEMQERYKELQGMQRQLAADIQDKMEFIYQKLIREIANQQMTTSPYMAMGPGLGKCMGPGICTGHGMPAGTAVCQFPVMDESARLQEAYKKTGVVEACQYCHGTGQNPFGACYKCQGTGHASNCPTQGRTHASGAPPCSHGGGPCAHGLEEYKVCPGAGICPGAGVCPSCKDDVLHSLRAPRHESLGRDGGGGGGRSDSQLDRSLDRDEKVLEVLKKECKNLILLPKDLEELRDRVKADGKIPNVFDEMDILERLHTLWEAVNALKHNDEAIAVRMIKQDAALKKLPRGAVMEKIQKIPPENLDAIVSASPDRPLIIPSITSMPRASEDEDDCGFTTTKITGPSSNKKERSGGSTNNKSSRMADDDIQTIFNNLSNLLLESATQKEKLENISGALKNMETTMVTKHMLIDALSDKADKGSMNTKVSYDEFGNSMDELTTRMQNLLIEVYQKNENWKNITDHLGEELGAKLDKIELAPVRAYFKSHLKTLEDKVNTITTQMEEPDPAGTRKKLLRDLNCISCDRRCNISGQTNSPQLPVIAGIMAGHTTASQRAYDLHRLRQQKICKRFAEGRDMNLVSQELQCSQGRGGSSFIDPSEAQTLNPSDVMNTVNRYVGGSHTSVGAGDRIAAMRKRYSKNEELGESLPLPGMDQSPPPLRSSRDMSNAQAPGDAPETYNVDYDE